MEMSLCTGTELSPALRGPERRGSAVCRGSRACLGSGKFVCQSMKEAPGEMSLMYIEAIEELAELKFRASDLLSDWNSHILSEVFVARAKVFSCLHIVLWNMY